MILRGSFRPLAALCMIHRHLIGREFTSKPKLVEGEGLVYLGAGYWRAAILGFYHDDDGMEYVDSSAYPGAVLPDAWLEPLKQRAGGSSLDIVGFRLVNSDKSLMESDEYEQAVALLAGLEYRDRQRWLSEVQEKLEQCNSPK